MHQVKVLKVKELTHDVNRYTVEKPENYWFVPGQATEVFLDHPKWKNEGRPFTFTSLNKDDHLEFIIKSYPSHNGVTEQIGKLQKGDSLWIDDPWGAIDYRGEGTFIAAGAGLTPFIAILRQLEDEGNLNGQHLLFSNKTEKDVILHSKWQNLLGNNYISTLTQKKATGYEHERFSKDFFQKHIDNFDQFFYICGPEDMVSEVADILISLGANKSKIIHEDLG